MRKAFIISTFQILTFFPLIAQSTSQVPGAWGDQGNGTFINPVLNADYSDPDLVRVDEDYYMVCSEFHFMGMPVLHSRDLVNWTIIAQIYRRFDFAPEYSNFKRYSGGSWAPSIRYHDNKFFVYFCTPDDGLYMSTAEKAGGPWSPVHEVKKIPKWEDPCPFWDDDGKAYLGHSLKGAGPIIIHRMSPDGKQLLDEGVTVYTGPVAEGTKIFKFNGYYYLIIPEGGVATGWQTVLRSRNIYGPYEKRVVLEKGSTGINGPHQGGLVQTQRGEWWFMHFQDRGTIGRVAHLQPVFWINEWPEMGVDIDRNGIGEPVYAFKKPDVGKVWPICAPQTSDEFNEPPLSLQWAWNHNPKEDAFSLTEAPGNLTLHAQKAENIWNAPNTLTQKIMGDRGEVTLDIDITGMSDNQLAGLCLISGIQCQIGVIKKDGKTSFYADDKGKIISGDLTKAKKMYLRINLRIPEKEADFLYSENGKDYRLLTTIYGLKAGFWKGLRVGIFSYNTSEAKGIIKINRFVYRHDGPGGGLPKQ
ncbi:MAG: glycoside hydrolase 43 family protein [Bacteroidales bacterium]